MTQKTPASSTKACCSQTDLPSQAPAKQSDPRSCCAGAAVSPPVEAVVAVSSASKVAPGESPAMNGDSTCCGSSVEPSGARTTSPAASPNRISACCGSVAADDGAGQQVASQGNCCAPAKQRKDWLLVGSAVVVSVLYFAYFVLPHDHEFWLVSMSHTAFEMANTMWWGVLLGVFFVGWLGRIPRELVVSVLGPGHSVRGVFRATLAGLLLDLCNHGILMVAMKLYERGASLGQVMAFMIASPWNSFTLTIILFALIGLQWTLVFIACSMLIAWVSGLAFDRLEKGGVLPMNPYALQNSQPVPIWPEMKRLFRSADYSWAATSRMLSEGLSGGKIVLRWLLFGIVLLALVRAFVPPESFATWFGASIAGLFLTLLVTTLLEVCSEGSSPIAADLVNRAQAPGNGFTFLMAGAATDYTEIMVLKDTTKSWKIALFLPLITVPQVLLLAYLMNQFA